MLTSYLTVMQSRIAATGNFMAVCLKDAKIGRGILGNKGKQRL
jgi:hypothetical protein